MILEQLGVSQYFSHVFLSSELGADKPDPLIYRRALKLSRLAPDEVLHVGDDPVRDWHGRGRGRIVHLPPRASAKLAARFVWGPRINSGNDAFQGSLEAEYLLTLETSERRDRIRPILPTAEKLGWAGLEPATNALKGRCSTIELPTRLRRNRF